MSRNDPFGDIVQPQPRSARQPVFQQDPFDDDDDPFNNAAQVGPSSDAHSQVTQGRQHGYALDPFFDEQVDL